MNALREPLIRTGALAIGVWVVGSVLAVAAALAGSGVLVVIALVASYVGDATMYAGDPRLPRWLGRHRLAAVHRALLRELTVLLAWLALATPTAAAAVAAVVAVLSVHAAHIGYRVITWSHRARRGGRLGWVNLRVDGHDEGPEVLPQILPRLWTVQGPRTVLHTDLFVVAGLAVGWLGGPTGAVVAGAVLTACAAAACVAAGLRRSRLIARLPTAADDNLRLRAAVDELAPEVVVYFSGGVGTTYQLNVWLETLERLEQPTLLLVRERHHLDQLLPTALPVVVASRATDVELVQTESMRVVLYPTTVIRNNHMLRLPGMRHVFINHGDGDKAVTSSPLHRAFDEIWVAGRAACDRYLQRGEGVRADQLVIVGRPQLAHITRGSAPGQPLTVLYAPTWEGNFDNVDYSSVAPMGVTLVQALLADPGVRVLFKPHPATGTRLRAAADALRVIETRLAEAPNGELVGTGPDALYDAFNACDVLLADVSSVVADFLASRKPYVMTNPRAVAHDDLERELPSTSGAMILDVSQAGEVAAIVREAVDPDPRRTRREDLAAYFLGGPEEDPVQRFVDEVASCIERARPRHEVAEPVSSEVSR